MKDLITILVCNSIRRAEHLTNEKGGQLTDQEVLQIALQSQLDYHKTEVMRFMNSSNGQMSAQPGKPKVSASGSVTPPSDMLEAARKTLGDGYEKFISEYGEDFTPRQLCEYTEVH